MYVPNVWESTVHTRILNTFSRLHQLKGLKAEVHFTQKQIQTTNQKAGLRLLKEVSLQRYLSFLVCLCNCERAVTVWQSRVYNLGLEWLFTATMFLLGMAPRQHSSYNRHGFFHCSFFVLECDQKLAFLFRHFSQMGGQSDLVSHGTGLLAWLNHAYNSPIVLLNSFGASKFYFQLKAKLKNCSQVYGKFSKLQCWGTQFF